MLARVAAAAGDARDAPADTTVQLTRTYRFGHDNGIGRLAAAIRTVGSDAAAVMEALAWRPQEARFA